MKVKTIVTERIERRNVREHSIFIAVSVHLINIISSVIVPFIIGFYFAQTRSLWFFLFFVAAIFFEFRMVYRGDTIKIKIMRLL